MITSAARLARNQPDGTYWSPDEMDQQIHPGTQRWGTYFLGEASIARPSCSPITRAGGRRGGTCPNHGRRMSDEVADASMGRSSTCFPAVWWTGCRGVFQLEEEAVVRARNRGQGILFCKSSVWRPLRWQLERFGSKGTQDMARRVARRQDKRNTAYHERE